MSLDQIGFSFFQSLTGNALIDQFMLYMADFLVLIVPLSMVYVWFKGRKGKEDSLLAFGSAVLGLAVSYGMSLLYFHQNPSAVFDTIVAAKPENAFPSQHTAVIFSAAWPLVWKNRKTTGYLLLAAALLTGFARVYIGEHWPVDILGSVVASGIGFAIVYLSEDHLDPVFEPLMDLGKTVEEKVPVLR